MKKIFLFLLLFFVAWDVGWGLMGVKPLFPWQLEEEYRQGNPDLVLLDVRTAAEFNWLHLAGAYHVPFHRLRAKNLDIPPKKNVVVICLTGHRSSLAAWRLQKYGYQNVYNLTWGMAGWEAYKFISGFSTLSKEPEREMKQVKAPLGLHAIEFQAHLAPGSNLRNGSFFPASQIMFRATTCHPRR